MSRILSVLPCLLGDAGPILKDFERCTNARSSMVKWPPMRFIQPVKLTLVGIELTPDEVGACREDCGEQIVICGYMRTAPRPIW